MRSTLKTKLSCRDQSYSAVYAENDIELSWSIGSGVNYDKN